MFKTFMQTHTIKIFLLNNTTIMSYSKIDADLHSFLWLMHFSLSEIFNLTLINNLHLKITYRGVYKIIIKT